MLGSAFGIGAHDLLPGVTAGAGAYGLVGMAAVFAAAGRAPITAVLIVFELTGDYSMILPLMLAVVVATGLSKLLGEDSIYTLKLRRRGIDIDRPSLPAGVLGGIKIKTAMHPGPSAVRAEAMAGDIAVGPPLLRTTDDLGRAVIWLAEGDHSALPVIAMDGGMAGWIEHRDVFRAYADANRAPAPGSAR